MSATSPTQPSYDVFVSDGPAGGGDERMPDGAPLAWSPLSTTLDGTRCEAWTAHGARPCSPPSRWRASARSRLAGPGGWPPAGHDSPRDGGGDERDV